MELSDGQTIPCGEHTIPPFRERMYWRSKRMLQLLKYYGRVILAFLHLRRCDCGPGIGCSKCSPDFFL